MRIRDKVLKSRLDSRVSEMDQLINTWLPMWADIQAYCLPAYGRGLSRAAEGEYNQGTDKQTKIFTSHPQRAHNILTAGLQASMTSPARPWFKLTLKDKDKALYKPIAEWLYAVEERIRIVFATSNVYDALHKGYGELSGFGTAPILIRERADTLIHLVNFTAGEYRIALNTYGQSDSFYRETLMSARQMREIWEKDRCSQAVNDAYDRSPDALFTICNFVEPNSDGLNIDRIRSRPFRSIYWEKGSDHYQVLAAYGYDRFPVLAPRWFVVGGDIYGWSPAMMNLPDVKMLHKMEKQFLKALDKVVDPPLLASGSLKNQIIKTIPGGVTYDEGPAGGNPSVQPLYQIRPDTVTLDAKIQKTENAIAKGFYNDLFLMLSSIPDTHQMTATEVAERHQEKLIMLGPVLERLHTELLNPLIDNAFYALFDNGLLPPPPEELAGEEIEVDYISILAQAQKAVGINSLNQMMGTAGNLMGVFPEIKDLFDIDRVVRDYADMSGVSPKTLRAEDVVQAIRVQRAQQEQAMQAMAMAESASGSAKLLSDTRTNGNNVLSQITGALGGAQ